MLACIIIHNIIIDDERDIYQNNKDPIRFKEENIQYDYESSSSTQLFNVRASRYNYLNVQQYMHMREETWDRQQVHNSLQANLVEHIWQPCQGWNDDE